jgi:hypothetical protein
VTPEKLAAARLAELVPHMDEPEALAEMRRLAALWPDAARVLPPCYLARVGLVAGTMEGR